MFDEVKAEITDLVGNLIFVRNLSLTFIMAIAVFFSLAELQSQFNSGARQSLVNISNSSLPRIVIKK